MNETELSQSSCFFNPSDKIFSFYSSIENFFNFISSYSLLFFLIEYNVQNALNCLIKSPHNCTRS